MYTIKPLENKGQIEDISGDVPVESTQMETGATREISVEIHLVADDGDEDYNARFTLLCTAGNEPGDRESNNSTSFDSSVLYW